jgi:uncharacterized protein (DUF1800 family)
MATSDPIAHLLRRAGFGATPSELSASTTAGYAATVDRLVGSLGEPDPGADAIATPILTIPPVNRAALKTDPTAHKALVTALRPERVALTSWWLARMMAATNPLTEKLTFLLHGHFPTGISKVRFPYYMYGQNQLFRSMGAAGFDDLTQAVATDPAMLIWLDAASDKASDPNENFARELMERFTMGLGSYSELDVRAGAFCFSGWRLNPRTHAFAFDPLQHSTTPQTFLGNSGVTSGQQVIDIVTNSSASARFVPAAFWSHLAYPVTPADPVVVDLAVGYGQDRNMANLLRAIFGHPAFTSETARNGLIKQPTEYVVGALRAFGVAPATVASSGRRLQAAMAGMGQVLFDPPSVGGWSQNEYWLSTAAALARWTFADAMAKTFDISAVADASLASRVDAVGHMLSVSWSSATAAALSKAVANPESLVTLALTSPDYVSN